MAATDIAVYTFTYSGSAGTVSFTDASVGFTPEAMIIIGGPTTTSADTETYFAHSIGIVNGSTVNCYSCASGDDFSTTSSRRYRSHGTNTNLNCICILDDQNDSEIFQAEFNQFVSNGVELQITDAATDVTFTCIFFRNLTTHVESYQALASTRSINVADPSFSIIQNAGVGSNDTVEAHNIYSIAFEKDGYNLCFGWGDTDADSTSDIGTILFTPNSATPGQTNVALSQQLGATLYYTLGVSTAASTLNTFGDSDSDNFGIGIFELNDRQTQVAIVSTPTDTGADWNYTGLNFEPAGGIIIANVNNENDNAARNLVYSICVFDKNHEACYMGYVANGAATSITKTQYTNQFIKAYAYTSTGANSFDIRNPTFQDGGWTISSTDIHALDNPYGNSRSFIGLFWGSAGDVTIGDEVSPNDASSNTSFDTTSFVQSHVFSTNEISSPTSIDTTSFSAQQTLSIDELLILTNIGNSSFNQTHVISTSELSTTTAIDGSGFTQEHVLATDELTGSTSIDAASYSVEAANLSVAELTVTSEIETPDLYGIIAFTTGGQGSGQYSDGYYESHKYNTSNASVHNTSDAIDGTTDDALYQSTAYDDPLTYQIPTGYPGLYKVTIKMIEPYFNAVGDRVFDIIIEGSTVESDIDIYAEVGHDFALDKEYYVSTTSDGVINITTSVIADNANFSAIKIERVQSQETTLTSDNQSIVTVIDATSFVQDHILAANELASLSSLDNTTLTQDHIFGPADVNTTSSIDTTSFAQGATFNPVDLAVITGIDAGSFAQEHLLSTDEVTSTTIVDSTNFAEGVTISIDDVAISTSIDSNSFVQNHVITTAELDITSSIDATTFTAGQALSAADLAITVDVATSSFAQEHILPADELDATSSIDTSSFTQEHSFSVEEIGVTTSIDVASFTEGVTLVVAEMAVTPTLDQPTMIVYVTLSPNGGAVSVSIDPSSFSQEHVISFDDMAISIIVEVGGFIDETIADTIKRRGTLSAERPVLSIDAKRGATTLNVRRRGGIIFNNRREVITLNGRRA
jgi:glutamine cyclotransferase